MFTLYDAGLISPSCITILAKSQETLHHLAHILALRSRSPRGNSNIFPPRFLQHDSLADCIKNTDKISSFYICTYWALLHIYSEKTEINHSSSPILR